MRFWNEFRNPKLKCERVGHKNQIEWREGYLKPKWGDLNYSYTVMNDVHQERRCCARCGDADEWVTTKRSGIQSFSAYKDMWSQIEAGNYWPRNGNRTYDANEVLRKAF